MSAPTLPGAGPAAGVDEQPESRLTWLRTWLAHPIAPYYLLDRQRRSAAGDRHGDGAVGVRRGGPARLRRLVLLPQASAHVRRPRPGHRCRPGSYADPGDPGIGLAAAARVGRPAAAHVRPGTSGSRSTAARTGWTSAVPSACSPRRSPSWPWWSGARTSTPPKARCCASCATSSCRCSSAPLSIIGLTVGQKDLGTAIVLGGDPARAALGRGRAGVVHGAARHRRGRARRRPRVAGGVPARAVVLVPRPVRRPARTPATKAARACRPSPPAGGGAPGSGHRRRSGAACRRRTPTSSTRSSARSSGSSGRWPSSCCCW